MFDPQTPLNEIGATWSSPSGVAGLGGNGRVQLIGNFVIPERAVTATLMLGIYKTFTSGVGNIGWLHARVKVGAGNSQYSFEMDWDNGSSITVPIAFKNSCTVEAVQYGLLDEGVSLHAALVLGPRSIGLPPTWTALVRCDPGVVGPPAVPSNTLVIVPARAKTLIVPRRWTSPFGTNPNASDLEIRAEQFGVGALGCWNHQTPNDSAIWTTGVVLPPNSQTVRLLSVTGTQIQPFLVQPVIFGLDG